MSLEVSPACHYHLPPTLLLNVLGQIAAFMGVKKKVWQKSMPLLSVSDLLTTSQVAVTRYRRYETSEVEMEDQVADKNAINNTVTPCDLLRATSGTYSCQIEHRIFRESNI
jgi:hypothetical protein